MRLRIFATVSQTLDELTIRMLETAAHHHVPLGMSTRQHSSGEAPGRSIDDSSDISMSSNKGGILSAAEQKLANSSNSDSRHARQQSLALLHFSLVLQDSQQYSNQQLIAFATDAQREAAAAEVGHCASAPTELASLNLVVDQAAADQAIIQAQHASQAQASEVHYHALQLAASSESIGRSALISESIGRSALDDCQFSQLIPIQAVQLHMIMKPGGQDSSSDVTAFDRKREIADGVTGQGQQKCIDSRHFDDCAQQQDSASTIPASLHLPEKPGTSSMHHSIFGNATAVQPDVSEKAGSATGQSVGSSRPLECGSLVSVRLASSDSAAVFTTAACIVSDQSSAVLDQSCVVSDQSCRVDCTENRDHNQAGALAAAPSLVAAGLSGILYAFDHQCSVALCPEP